MKYPPLKLWVVSSLLLISLFGILLWYKKSISQFLFNKPIEVAFGHANPDEKSVKVVLLCSSLGQQGLSDADELTKLINSNNEITYSFVKISKSNAALGEYVENEVLVRKIQQYKADYVVIQESFVCFERKKPIQSIGLIDDIPPTYLKALIFGFDEVYGSAMKNFNSNMDTRIDTTKSDFPIIYSRQLRELNNLLSQFSNRLDSRIILLHIPLPYPIEQKLDSIRETREYVTLFNHEKKGSSFEYFKFENHFPFQYYYDQTHMNDKGEKVYSRLFLERLHQFHVSTLE